MTMTVLVTGANGFVGSHVLEALQQRADIRIVAACRDHRKLPASFKGEVRPGDLRDVRYLEELVSGVDVICNAAAWTALFGHAKESRQLFLEPTLALIKAARAAGVKRFINTSTTSAAAPDASADAMSRGIPRRFWPHLCNVIAIENVLRNQASTGFQVVNLRLGIFAGQRYALGVLPILVPRLKTRLVPWVAGGKTSLPMIDGRDVGQAFALAATTSGLALCHFGQLQSHRIAPVMSWHIAEQLPGFIIVCIHFFNQVNNAARNKRLPRHQRVNFFHQPRKGVGHNKRHAKMRLG